MSNFIVRVNALVTCYASHPSDILNWRIHTAPMWVSRISPVHYACKLLLRLRDCFRNGFILRKNYEFLCDQIMGWRNDRRRVLEKLFQLGIKKLKRNQKKPQVKSPVIFVSFNFFPELAKDIWVRSPINSGPVSLDWPAVFFAPRSPACPRQ